MKDQLNSLLKALKAAGYTTADVIKGHGADHIDIRCEPGTLRGKGAGNFAALTVLAECNCAADLHLFDDVLFLRNVRPRGGAAGKTAAKPRPAPSAPEKSALPEPEKPAPVIPSEAEGSPKEPATAKI